jgi:hypothetical protein
MNLWLPVNWSMKLWGDGWPRRDSAARYTPAGHPSVRASRALRSEPVSVIPATADTSAPASDRLKRNSRIPISVTSPAARRRASSSGGVARVMRTTWTACGRSRSRPATCSWHLS